MNSSLALIWTITAATTLLQAGNGLLQALMPLRMQAEGISVASIGVVAAAYGLGFSTGCLLAPSFIRHVGYIRAFASLAAVVSVLILVMTQAHSTLAWIFLRGLTGVTLACIFTVTDGWISARAISSHRGRILSIYMICTKVALMVSPLGIGFGNIRTDGLFMAVSALITLSLLPIAATTTKEPAAPQGVRIEVRKLFATAPSAVVGAFVVGLVNGPVIAITPVFGVTIGLSQDQAAALLFALQAGSLAMQWPLGWLSDRADRRYVIAGLAAGTSLVSLLILWASAQGANVLILWSFAAWGGLALCIYSVCVAHACDIVDPGQIVSTVGTLLFSWATGVTVGPLFGALAMEMMGPKGLFIYSAFASLGLVAFIVMRILQVQRSPARGGFADIAPTSTATASLTPRADVDGLDDQSLATAGSRKAEASDQKAEPSAVARADTAS
ncbi:MFS transporter [Microvirga terrae]|uniref:MFS transporter n=1 Tax=Microvirga terrae TaxID=2740529 RepID=A0ABY5RP40_9HYPH|nr:MULTISPECIES: MFS transporter [Microvirga]MBQ0822081.1 MFS transporter [Microvirga sp. HBU67558]UVF19021.1 MFS transporter [Microvirga terrae]